MRSNKAVLGFAGVMLLAYAQACNVETADDESNDATEQAASAYIGGIVAIDAQHSQNGASLVDGSTGASLSPWHSSNVYDAGQYPMRVVFDLGQSYSVTEIGLFHGNGAGLVDVKYLPIDGDEDDAASFVELEAHTPSLWNAWENVAISAPLKTRYLELTVASKAQYAEYSEIRVKGTPTSGGGDHGGAGGTGGTGGAGGGTPSGITTMAVGEYQDYFLVNGKIFGLGVGQNIGATGESKGVPLPLDVPAGTTFTAVASGLHQSLAVDSTGHVWTWGDNERGQSGIGTLGGNLGPKKIDTDQSGAAFTGVTTVYSHYLQNFALKSDGSVWAWGRCEGGLCGTPSLSGNVSRPNKIPFPSGVKITQMSIGSVVLARATDGSVYSWGGTGTYDNKWNLATGADGTTPQKITALPANIVQVAAGGNEFNYARTASGDLWAWGHHGAFMGYADNHAFAPQSVNALYGFAVGVKDVGTNDETTHAVLNDGSLWGWGANGQGEVGNLSGQDWAQTNGNYSVWGGAQVMVIAPVRVAPSVHNFKRVFANAVDAFYVFAETDDNRFYFMGRNKNGLAGDGIYPAGASGNYYAGVSICGAYPNSWDVPLAKLVSPMAATTGIPTLSPYCVAHPGGFPCNAQ